VAKVMPLWDAPDRPVSLNPFGAELDAALDARDLRRLEWAVAWFLYEPYREAFARVRERRREKRRRYRQRRAATKDKES
jgi:hypothetical protein